ncbi:MAG: hypothetical protein HS104_22355 [Polyangiaceae bacterium]|nr:hypothetical protein [Polyangiaceae bacterium]MCL4750031.1 hypothetical protein [Myxococcales bacterium]
MPSANGVLSVAAIAAQSKTFRLGQRALASVSASFQSCMLALDQYRWSWW